MEQVEHRGHPRKEVDHQFIVVSNGVIQIRMVHQVYSFAFVELPLYVEQGLVHCLTLANLVD